MGCLYVVIIRTPAYCAIIAVIIMWAVAASVSRMKYKEESFAHYSMYRTVKEMCEKSVGVRE